jgi:copper transport protein
VVLALLAALLFVPVFVLLVDERPAQAHGYILRSIPADRAVLPRSPSRIQIWFTENLEPRFSSLTITDEKGKAIPLEEVGVAPTNPAQLAARLPSALPDGAYVVAVRAAFASDGHVGVETLTFWVGKNAEMTPAGVGVIAERAIPLEIIWRILTLVPLSILFGTFLLYQIVLLPGWGNTKYQAGGLAPRVMSTLNSLIWVSIGVAALGSILALFQQTEVLFSTSLEAAISNGLWPVVLRGTQFGDMLTARLLLLMVAAILQAGTVYLAPRQPRDVSRLWRINTIVAATALGTLSASSHAAGSALWSLPSVVVDWLHLLATSSWIGGLVALVTVMPVALERLGKSDRRMALLVALRRFSAVGVAAVALLLATGIYSALLYLRQPADVARTNYGATLVFKGLLVLPLLLFGLYHHASVTHGRLAALAQRWRISDRALSLASSVRAESMLGVAVIVVAAVLTATPPPVPPEARSKVEPPSQALAVNDMQVQLSIDPGAAGSNTYQIALSRGGQTITGAQVKLRLVYPALDKRTALLPLDDMGDGTYLGAGLELDRPGVWQALVDITLPDQGADKLPIRAAFSWRVPDTIPDPSQRQPTLLNWLAGGLVLAVAGVWLYPGIVGRLRSVRVEIVSIAVAAMLITVVLAALGAWLLNDSAQRTAALRNPTPLVVNPTLPDAQSVAAGKANYDANCATCHGPTGAGGGPQAVQSPAGAPPDIRARLPTRRDEDLFRLIPHPNGNLVGKLSEADRWNVINFLRSAVFAAPGDS